MIKILALHSLLGKVLLVVYDAAERPKSDIQPNIKSARNFPKGIGLPHRVIHILKSGKSGLFGPDHSPQLGLCFLPLFPQDLDLRRQLGVQEALSISVPILWIFELSL
jgi:hypothetical protein